MVICPVNENNAGLMVSDGRAMLWELKAHTGKAAANPRYTHTQICKEFCQAILQWGLKRQEEVAGKSLTTL